MSFELLTVLCCCGGLMALAAAAGSSTSLSRAPLVAAAAAAARRPLPASSDLPLQSVRRSQRKPFSHALTKSGLPANDWDAALPPPPPMRRRHYLTPALLADTTSPTPLRTPLPSLTINCSALPAWCRRRRSQTTKPLQLLPKNS